MRYKVQVLGWTLIWSGFLIFGYVGWQLYGTDLVNAGIQAEAVEDLVVELAEAPAAEPEVIDTAEFLGPEAEPEVEVPDAVELLVEDSPTVGESFAFMNIPKIGIEDLVLYEGVDLGTLKSGPGHMPDTPLPGQAGNSVISGHRTTYGRPFFDFDLLEVGDRIEVQSATGVHVYEVRELQVVLPTDVWVTDPRPGGWLTLTTCNPKFSARERLIVWAEMVQSPNLDFINLHKTKFSA